MSVSRDPMIAITSPLQMSMFAMNLSRSPGARCNQCEHGPPMIATIGSDDCERLHIHTTRDSNYLPLQSQRTVNGSFRHTLLFRQQGNQQHPRGTAARSSPGPRSATGCSAPTATAPGSGCSPRSPSFLRRRRGAARRRAGLRGRASADRDGGSGVRVVGVGRDVGCDGAEHFN